MCIVDLITERSHRAPDAIAASCGKRSLSYGQLDARATQLANYLLENGVAKEALVGVALAPSCDVAVAVLGVLKSGAAYLPLDLSYPRERLHSILEDAQPALIVTTETGSKRLPQGPHKLVYVDSACEAILAAPAVGNFAPIQRGDLAYVIFTSGSTGHPKGVLLEHGGLCDMALSHARQFGIHPKSRVLQFASLGFDASISELFMTFVAGGCLVFPDGVRPDVGQPLIDILRDQEITNVLFPPSTLTALPDADLPHLETLIAGGERCSAEVVGRWAPGRAFFNAYGPTEVTVTATMWRCEASEANDPPIGRPRDGTKVYILDDCLQPVSPGSTGELCVAGSGVARGYLNLPELTQRAFVNAESAAERIYRTGDIARQRADGAFEFVGRLDRQVKVRGFRVELDDVEKHVKDDDQVESASVQLEQREGSHDCLVAYLVPKPGEQIITAQLRQRLACRLPEFMLPAKLVIVDQLPSGGTATSSITPIRSANLRPPNTPLQKQLLDIWREVLGTDDIGIDDHFVELGGDSLLSARVAHHASDAGIELTPQHVLRYPTVAKLAKLLES